MQQTKAFKISVFFGALLFGVGLFFFQYKDTPRFQKPSDADFSQSNHPPAQKSELDSHTAPGVMAPVDPGRKEMKLESPVEFSEADAKQWKTFQEVVFSRNDNDPRIDSELRTLSPKVHEALRKAYQAIPAENRNSRGTVVFLIARDLQTLADAEFLKKVYQEDPCLSLSDCTKAGESDPHSDGSTQTTLNYPQLAGLFQLEQRLAKNPGLIQNPDIRAEIANLLREARQFPGSSLQKRAEELQKRYGL
jgi:hypothetical protein